MNNRTSIVKISLGILILALVIPYSALAEEDNPWKKVPVCTFGMPYIGHAVGPHESGLVTGILKAVFKPENIILAHKELPYKRALEELASGKIQCSLGIRDSRKGFYQGKTTMAFYDLSVAYKRTTEWKGVESLKGEKVSYLHGFALNKFVSVDFEPQLVYDLSSAYHMLDRGHITYILGDSKLLQDAMYESKVPSHNISITALKSYAVIPIFSKTEEGKKFRDVYDRRMKEMMASGEFAGILTEFGLSKKTIKKILDAN